MANVLLNEDAVYAPYFIFVRCHGVFSDAELLKLFHLTDYSLVQVSQKEDFLSKLQRNAVVASDDEWTMLADDWFYTLWHMKSTRKVIAKLGKQFELFACSIGDTDHSFDFVYYQDGKKSVTTL